MENSYGIGVANRYALFLDDESDPLETLNLKEKEKELKKKTKVTEKENKVKTEPAVAKGKPAAPQKKPIKDSNKVQENKRDDSKPPPRSSAEGKPERERFNKFNNENREERNNRRNREEKTFNGSAENQDREERPRRGEGNDGFESRPRGERREPRAIGNKPGGPRGPRRNFDDRRGKREFDRQSGSDKTGVKPVDKREGAGAHNWGSHKDVIEEADRPNTELDNSWGEEVQVSTEPEKKEETETETAPVEEEAKELTLDEWKAQRAGRAKPVYNLRKAGEGEDPSQWKKMYELRKKENAEKSFDQESSDEEYDASEYPQRVGRQKHILDIDIQFYDSRRPGVGGPRGRGGRGGGGGPRGGRGGGGGRPDGAPQGGRAPQGPNRERFNRERGDRDDSTKFEDRSENRQAPKVDDERDFPSLG
ncbi:unnamed protein product [Acanthoscelides obtectus]|uniref:Hyaluronan/mRNA-binding protein domain-containing protein n=1 Tax=Acanthoscelides obtectus TaxID=200917 RepID=A0A9P0KPZ1_ACAOB|nr:unnamed protein product [Acanthoscelides obtectus]CAK1628637.1 Plasminogen activator inhibitor 1 RNA-binding protein [Acanthoscelides obtectus]